jgi:hypothetical protein
MLDAVGRLFYPQKYILYTVGDFKVGVSAGVCCTKCTLNTGVNTNFEMDGVNYHVHDWSSRTWRIKPAKIWYLLSGSWNVVHAYVSLKEHNTMQNINMCFSEKLMKKLKMNQAQIKADGFMQYVGSWMILQLFSIETGIRIFLSF